MDTITFDCPGCAQRIETPAEMAGTGLLCPSCELSFCVPFPTKQLISSTQEVVKRDTAQPVYTMEGRGCWLEVYDDKIVIITSGHKTIPFRSIMAIQFKPAGLINGYLEFTIQGGAERQSSAFISSDGEFAFSATANSNTFTFTNGFWGNDGNDEIALKIKDFIESRIQALSSEQQSPQLGSLSDEIAKLAKLRTQGILSEDEFKAAKKRLLN